MRITNRYHLNILSLCVTFLLLIPKDVIANSSFETCGWFATIGAGLSFSSNFDNTSYATSGMPGFPEDKYKITSIDQAPLFSSKIGYHWRLDNVWLDSYHFGIRYLYQAPRIKGVIYVNSLPDSRNFKYKYDVNQNVILAEFKTNFSQYNRLIPYLSVGAGVSINQVKNYSDEPIPGQTVYLRRDGFTSSTSTQPAASVGAGVDYILNQHTQLSVGYLFLYTGLVKTGSGRSQLSANHLANRLYANSIEAQLAYYF